MLLTQRRMIDCKGVALMFEAMPAAPVRLADRGYDADGFRHALAAQGTAACIPSRKGGKSSTPHDAVRYARSSIIAIPCPTPMHMKAIA